MIFEVIILVCLVSGPCIEKNAVQTIETTFEWKENHKNACFEFLSANVDNFIPQAGPVSLSFECKPSKEQRAQK